MEKIIGGRFGYNCDLREPTMPVHPHKDHLIDVLGDSIAERKVKHLNSLAIELDEVRKSIAPDYADIRFGKREVKIAILQQQEDIILGYASQYLRHLYSGVRNRGRTIEVRRGWAVVLTDGPKQELARLAKRLGLGINFTCAMLMARGGY
jgi:hypothetical protein